MYSPNNIIIDT